MSSSEEEDARQWRQHSYTIEEKIAAIKLAVNISVRPAAKLCLVPRGMLRVWVKKAKAHMEYKDNKKKKTLGGQGRHEIAPFAQELVTYMKDRRRNDKHLATRHGFSQQTPSETKQCSIELEGVKRVFSGAFWGERSLVDMGGMINVDETGIYYDMPPKKIWNMGGVQQNAWMDIVGWEHYISDLLRHEIECPSVLIVDNLDFHVSQTSQDQLAEKACCTLVPLPPNSTSVCQPLDVGVMGPLEAKLRAKWLTEREEAKSVSEKRKIMIKRTIAAWNELTPESVSSSFEKAIPHPTEATI